jgi:hypothetical protein
MNIGLCPLVYNKIKLNLSHKKKCMRDYMSQEEPMSSETATQYVLISTRYISQFFFFLNGRGVSKDPETVSFQHLSVHFYKKAS